MSDPAAPLFALFDRLGIASTTHDHPPVFTVEQARAHWAAIDAAHAKNLLLKDAGGVFWLVVMPADMPLDLKALPARIGSKRLRFAPPDDLMRLLGVESGSVSPLALINDSAGEVRLVLDTALSASPRLGFHPLDNRRTTVLTREGFDVFLAAIGVTPIMVSLD